MYVCVYIYESTNLQIISLSDSTSSLSLSKFLFLTLHASLVLSLLLLFPLSSIFSFFHTICFIISPLILFFTLPFYTVLTGNGDY